MKLRYSTVVSKSVQNYLKNYLIQLLLGALAFLIWQAYQAAQTPPSAPQDNAPVVAEERVQPSVVPNPTLPIATQSADLSVDTASSSATKDSEEQAFLVTKVVDGDTIKVLLGGKTETVRIVGINTPETVDPRKPVECFGAEASAKMKELVENQTVHLETDATQSDRDRYGRLLRFVFLPDGTDVGLVMIREGFAQESLYSTTPHKYRQTYVDAQKQAANESRGMWNAEACPGLKP